MDEIFQWIMSQSGVAGIAAFALWIMKWQMEQSGLRRSEELKQREELYAESIRREQENASTHREDKKLLLDIVRANTESNTKLVEVINRLDYDLVRKDKYENRPIS